MPGKKKVMVVEPAYPAQLLQTYGGLSKEEAKREADAFVKQARASLDSQVFATLEEPPADLPVRFVSPREGDNISTQGGMFWTSGPMSSGMCNTMADIVRHRPKK